MESVVLVIHLFLALAIIGLVLIQRSEGGGLGIGGSNNGGLGNLASAQGTANALTRITGFCAAGFFVTSLLLGIIAGRGSGEPSLIDAVSKAAPAAVEQAVPAAPTSNTDTDEKTATKPLAPVTE